MIGNNGEKIKKCVFVDDQNNTVNENDIEYINET
jgi:hypothetical protein